MPKFRVVRKTRHYWDHPWYVLQEKWLIFWHDTYMGSKTNLWDSPEAAREAVQFRNGNNPIADTDEVVDEFDLGD